MPTIRLHGIFLCAWAVAACATDNEPNAALPDAAEAAATEPTFVVATNETSGVYDTTYSKYRCKGGRCTVLRTTTNSGSAIFQKTDGDCASGVTIKFEARFNSVFRPKWGSKTITCSSNSRQEVTIQLEPIGQG